MRSCWIVYDRRDLERNRFFAERLAQRGRELGMDASVVLTDCLPPGCPDCAVNRSRDADLAERLEDGGAAVFNSSRVTRICNDKLETYRMAECIGVPFLPVSPPGGPLPPGPPWVVKSRVGHGGTEVFRADSPGEVADAVERLEGRLPLVQSMASDPGRDMRVYVLGGRVLASVMRTGRSDFRANRGLGGDAALCGLPGDAADAVERVCAELEPDLAGVDFVFSGGRALLNEVEDAVGTRMLYELTGLDPAGLLMGLVHSKTSL